MRAVRRYFPSVAARSLSTSSFPSSFACPGLRSPARSGPIAHSLKFANSQIDASEHAAHLAILAFAKVTLSSFQCTVTHHLARHRLPLGALIWPKFMAVRVGRTNTVERGRWSSKKKMSAEG